jgi:hypothetical protein
MVLVLVAVELLAGEGSPLLSVPETRDDDGASDGRIACEPRG